MIQTIVTYIIVIAALYKVFRIVFYNIIPSFKKTAKNSCGCSVENGCAGCSLKTHSKN